MSYDITLNDNNWEDCEQTLGNDGSIIVQERNTYSYNVSPLPLSPKHINPQIMSFLSVFKGKGADDFKFELSPEYLSLHEHVVINGYDMATITSEEINEMSLEDAREFVSQIQLEGNLMKKGFRRLKLWKRRYFILRGNEFLYFDKDNLLVPRRRCEITPDCKILVENISGKPFAFSVLPCKGQNTYFLEGFSILQRDQWVHYLSIVLFLMKRIYTNTNFKSNPPIHDNISLQDTLGKGRYGVVRLGQDLKTGEMYAVKVINKLKVGESVLDQELVVLRSVMENTNSEDIVRVLNIYEDSYLVYVVMEYLGGGDLRCRIIRNQFFSEKQAATVICHVGRALDELHSKHIFHLDVKPENIIYESNDKHSLMKLADFGCSLISNCLDKKTNEIVGTVGFMAPENCEYTEKADVYSLGVTLFILLMGYPPYQSETPESLLQMTVERNIIYDEDDWKYLSSDALLLVKNMLAKNPEERLSIKEVLNFPWVNNPPKSMFKPQMGSSKHLTNLDMSLPSTLPLRKSVQLVNNEY